jgi:hypothetical protein
MEQNTRVMQCTVDSSLCTNSIAELELNSKTDGDRESHQERDSEIAQNL